MASSGAGDSLAPPSTGAATAPSSTSHSVPGTPQQHGAGGSSINISGMSLTPPNSAGLRQPQMAGEAGGGNGSVFDFKFKRQPSLKVLLTKLPSTDSLSNSPAPSSPGIANWASDNRDGNLADKSPSDVAKLNRKESYKAQRKNYRREKKRVASELMNSLQDPAVIVLADWLKVRGTLKSWTKLWCVLKPGLLLIYKSQKTKSSHWVGTVMLTSCQVIERPSKKDGFCFKLFHPLEQSIWAPRGPDKETIGAVVQPLPTAYLIFRAPSQAAGKCWMDALELSLRCSALLLRSNNSTAAANAYVSEVVPVSHETQWSEADYERHFNEHELLLGSLQRRHAQYLALPELETSRSENSLTSRAHTPLLQQLYSSAISKRLPRFRSKQSSQKQRKAYDSAASSIDLTLQQRRRHLSPISKSKSLGAVLRAGSSSDDEYEEENEGGRPVSAPPVCLLRPQFRLHVKDLDADSQNEAGNAAMSGMDSETESDAQEAAQAVPAIKETNYVPVTEDEFGEQGEQVEELAEENKSLIWCIVKQVRPGMDLSKVVLPTFILEPRSFLDKLSDSYFHADILSRAVREDDPYMRMKYVVQWYLSSFYKKPKGLKKPYNPILGESFRCYWQHSNGSRTFYIAEQVSHHPPVSAFYVTNREDGFSITCSILAKSKFYGNSTSAVLEGAATMTLLPRGECYTASTPYAHCKGILMGTLSVELGGKINIECENTGYKTELEFKLKPFLGGSESTNVVAGKIKHGKDTMATIQGYWDKECRIKETRTGEETLLFKVDAEMRMRRLPRYLVPLDEQLPTESERLWQLVSQAIQNEDQVAATEEKTVLEEQQRQAAKEREANETIWQPAYFEVDNDGQWSYKYADLRPWDAHNDVRQYEHEYKILTQTRHKPVSAGQPDLTSRALHQAHAGVRPPRQLTTGSVAKAKNKSLVLAPRDTNSDSSQSPQGAHKRGSSSHTLKQLVLSIEQMNKALDLHTRQLNEINQRLERMQYAPPSGSYTSLRAGQSQTQLLGCSISQTMVVTSVVYALVGLACSLLLRWLFK